MNVKEFKVSHISLMLQFLEFILKKKIIYKPRTNVWKWLDYCLSVISKTFLVPRKRIIWYNYIGIRHE